MINLGGFNLKNGKTVAVNLSQITYITQMEDNTCIIHFASDSSALKVTDSFEDIINVFINANQQELNAQASSHKCHCHDSNTVEE